MASVDEVRGVLVHSAVPSALVDELLAAGEDLWLAGESPDVVAADIALCDPPLGPDEVRVAITATQIASALRVSVLAHDRPGLLAVTAGVLARNAHSIVQAAAMTWAGRGWAVQRFLVAPPRAGPVRPAARDILRARIRAAVAAADRPVVPFVPAGQARVRVERDAHGHPLVRVAAPDRLGLLWAISDWLERNGCNIVAARAAPLGDGADDAFIVDGEPDEAGLAAYLSGDAISVGSSR